MLTAQFDQVSQNRLIARFETLPRELRERLVAQLRRAETQGFVDSFPNRVSAKVKILVDPQGGRSARGLWDAGKVAALEYGASGTGAFGRKVTITALRFLRDAEAGARA